MIGYESSTCPVANPLSPSHCSMGRSQQLLFGALLVIQSCQANNSLPVFKTKACCYSISGVPDTSLPPGAGLPQQDDLLEGGQDDHQDDHLDGDHSSSHDSQKIST